MSFTTSADSEIGFYGCSLSAKDGAYTLSIPDDRSLNLTSASLAVASLSDTKPTSVVAVCPNESGSKQKAAEYVVCTLTAQQMPSRTMELLFVPEQPIQLKIVGPGTVHLVGYTTVLGDSGQYDSDEEGEGQFVDEHGNVVPLHAGMNGNGQYFDDDSDEDSDDESDSDLNDSGAIVFNDEMEDSDDDDDDDSNGVDTSNGKIKVIASDEDSDDMSSEDDNVAPAPAPVKSAKSTPAPAATKQTPATKRKAEAATPAAADAKKAKATVTPAPAKSAPAAAAKPSATKAAPAATAAPSKANGGATATPSKTSNAPSADKIKCTECDKLLSGEPALKQHMQAKHTTTTPATTPAAKTAAKATTATKAK